MDKLESEIISLLEKNTNKKINQITYEEVLDIKNKMSTIDEGPKFFPNNYINIEYHNLLGKIKAKSLVKMFDTNPEFYKLFLEKFDKIVIKNDLFISETINNNELLLNCEVNYSEYSLAKIILSQYCSGCRYDDYIIKKLTNKETLISKEQIILLLKYYILVHLRNKNKIDMFKYLELMDGQVINEDYYYNLALIELSFDKKMFGLLKVGINDQTKDLAKEQILNTLYKEYSMDLFNNLLNYQEKQLNKYKKGKDKFLNLNLESLYDLFNDELSIISNKIINNDNYDDLDEDIIVNREQAIEMVIDFFSQIDKTQNLKNIFIKNIKNGKMLIWDINDEITRKEMYDKYSKDFNIYEPACITYKNKKGNEIVNIPFESKITDIPVIIHEFIHLVSHIYKKGNSNNNSLHEFPSIYFEMLSHKFLKNKGFSTKKINNIFNKRILDSIINIFETLPIITYLLEYIKNKNVSYEYILKKVGDTYTKEKEELVLKNLPIDDINNILRKKGYCNNLNDTVNNIILNLIFLLLTERETIIKSYPYILGTILAIKSIESNINIEEILNISIKIHDNKDSYYILKKIGIDVKKYGFVSFEENLEVSSKKM